MEKQSNPGEAGYKLINILLMEDSFKREVLVNFNQPEIKTTVDIDVDVQVNVNMVFVTETLKYAQTHNGVVEVSAMIRMVGIFERVGDPPLDITQFGSVNGAAIIFPYIREHLTNLSAKGGIGHIMLAPFNFTKKKPISESDSKS